MSVRGSISTAISAEASTKKACLIDPIRSTNSLRRHDRRRTAAKVDMIDLHAAFDLPRYQIEFAAQRRGIDRNRLVAADHRGVTAAIPAHRPAERDMQIERSAGVARDRLQPFGVGLGADGGREMRGGRIAGISRQTLLSVAGGKIRSHSYSSSR